MTGRRATAAVALVVLVAGLRPESLRASPAPGESARGAQGTAAPVPPTFSRDVAPILFTSCVPCHRPGGVAPFSLLTHEDAKRRARLIAHVTGDRYMPPWLPGDADVELVGDRRLTASEIETLARWAAAGAPAGDPAELPPHPRLVEGWQLGEPDLVVALDEPYTLPADAPSDVFHNFVLPLPVASTRWVRAVELRPGNPRIVHHAVVQVDETRGSRRRDDREPGPGFSGMEMGDSHLPDGHLVAWTPGRVPFAGREGMAWRLEPGTDLVLQLHMLPTGKPETIQPRVGLFFADEPSRAPSFTITLGDEEIDIPAGARDHRVADTFELPVAVELYAVYPHAHYLAREMTVTATLPDGRDRTLLHIPEWDFSWQDEYHFVPGARLPAGTRLEMVYSYDNSTENPRNPHVPPERVRFGYRSSDEMAFLSLQLIMEDEAAREALQRAEVEKRLADTPSSWRAHQAMGRLLLDEGRWEEAVGSLRRAAALAPEKPSLRLDLGRALRRTGREDEALGELQRAVELDPASADALAALGLALEARGRLGEAVALFRRAVDAAPDSAGPRIDLGMALTASGDLEAADRELRRALELDPDASFAHLGLGRVAAARDELPEAIGHYRRAHQADPDNANAAFALGTTLLGTGRSTEAIEPLRRAVAAAPGEPEGRRALAEALLAAGDPAAAEEQLARAAELAPADPAIPAARARVAQAAGRFAEAADHQRRVVDLLPGDAAAHYNLGVALTLAGRLDDAIEQLRRAVATDPRYLDALSAMARTLADHPDPALRRPEAAERLAALAAELAGGG